MSDLEKRLAALEEKLAALSITREPDALVPDPVVLQEFGITAMSLVRWDRDPELGFPPKIKIRGHNFRSRRGLEEFKKRMMQRALSD